MSGLLLSQVKGVFDVIARVDSDLVPLITYLEAAFAEYSTDTRSYRSGFCEHPNIPVVIAQPETDTADTDIARSSAKFVISAKNLPVTPKIQDRVKTADGQHYSILKVRGVSGDSLWLIYGCEVAP